MDLSKLLDVTGADPICQSDSIISKNTSFLKSFSCFEPSSSTVTTTSALNGNSNNDEETLKQLIQQVTKQDLILNIIDKCVQENSENKPENDVAEVAKSIPIKNSKINRFAENKKIANKNSDKLAKKFTNSTPSTSGGHTTESTSYNMHGTTNSTLLDSELKNKIQKIITYNSLKATYEENNLDQVLDMDSEQFDIGLIGGKGDAMKLNQQEADGLNKVVEKCVDQMYAHTILEKRNSSTKSSLDRVQELQTKIAAKHQAIESLLISIGNTQDEMIRLSTEGYHRSVIQESYNIAAMTAANVNKLHAQAVLSLGTDGGANMSQTLPSHQPSPTDLNEPFPALDDSISSLKSSISSIKLEISDCEERLARHQHLESNPGSAAVYKTIRKLQNAIKQKKFILKQLVGNSD